MARQVVSLESAAMVRADRPRRFDPAGWLAALWHTTGLQHVAEAVLDMGRAFPSFDAYWQLHLQDDGPSGTDVTG
jgi:hypothetical protein